MKKQRRMMAVVGLVLGMSAMVAPGQGATIASFPGNGRLTWTNAVNTNALYRVEWAAQAEGPWQRTFANVGSLDGLTATGFSVAVPMFYRVVMATNPPPVGMVWIDGGDVELGQASVGGDAVPVHTNYISGFWMDAMKVTPAKWAEVRVWATNNGYDFYIISGDGKASNHPAYARWYDAAKWCNARSEMEKLQPVYNERVLVGANYVFKIYRYGEVAMSNSWVTWSGNGYRLPTEAEWEKAARGGRQRKLFPWGGDTIQHARANYWSTNVLAYDTSPTRGYHPDYGSGGGHYTSPVGSFPANGYGLYDMAGNLEEWCWDRPGTYSAAYATDPRGTDTGTVRVVRGGSGEHPAAALRCANRMNDRPSDLTRPIGFRCVRGP